MNWQYVSVCLLCVLLVGCNETQPSDTDSMSITQVPAHVDTTTEHVVTSSREMGGNRGAIRGISNPQVHGTVATSYDKGIFHLISTVEGLNDIDSKQFFYEGWLLRDAPLSFVSIGILEKQGNIWGNDFKALTDWSEYTHYVVTLEPMNDGDAGGPNPKPAVHVAEGEMVKK